MNIFDIYIDSKIQQLNQHKSDFYHILLLW